MTKIINLTKKLDLSFNQRVNFRGQQAYISEIFPNALSLTLEEGGEHTVGVEEIVEENPDIVVLEEDFYDYVGKNNLTL